MTPDTIITPNLTQERSTGVLEREQRCQRGAQWASLSPQATPSRKQIRLWSKPEICHSHVGMRSEYLKKNRRDGLQRHVGDGKICHISDTVD